MDVEYSDTAELWLQNMLLDESIKLRNHFLHWGNSPMVLFHIPQLPHCYGVAQSRTRLKQLSSSSSSLPVHQTRGSDVKQNRKGIGRTDAKAETLNTLATSCEELTHWKNP